ncbi:MAG TPA: polysaccharide pyruvyl transferase family protein [Myxococcota bacterium]|nr:polysaccharide pyruvyl transferase family protein [Myxococcota bacterium]
MSVLDRLRDALQPALDAASRELDPDVLLQRSMSLLIDRARTTYRANRHGAWRPGEPLRLLLAGYAGTRNTGGDVRVEEMIRQFRHVLGPDNVELSILTFDRALTRGYFRATRQIEMPLVFPKFLYDQVMDQHGVVACEGSMFKAKFASALTTFMVGALGLANAGDKLSIAYGGEAGAMTPTLEDLVRRTCAESLVICRNQASREVLADLGVKSSLGTDTAWTFAPAPDAVGRELLRAAGWDGERPILAIAPINPFWWPVRPDLARTAAHAALGLFEHERYRSIYFHHWDDEVERRQETYLDALAHGVRPLRRRERPFIICVGMEQLDRPAAEALAARLDGAPVFVSDRYDMFQMVSVLRQARWLVASRYHAVVTSMPAGVLSVGVSMDERIRNLMADRGTPDLCLGVDDPDLARGVARALDAVDADPDAERERLRVTVAANLERMGRMGMILADYVRDRLPRFPLPDGRGRGGAWWDHLPPVGPDIAALIELQRGRAP